MAGRKHLIKPNHGNVGKVHTEETKALWSKLKMGHTVSDETRQKMAIKAKKDWARKRKLLQVNLKETEAKLKQALNELAEKQKFIDKLFLCIKSEFKGFKTDYNGCTCHNGYPNINRP